MQSMTDSNGSYVEGQKTHTHLFSSVYGPAIVRSWPEFPLMMPHTHSQSQPQGRIAMLRAATPETCEDDLAPLMTHGETTSGPVDDGEATPKIHAALQQRAFVPGSYIVDAGSLDAERLVESRDVYGVDLLGPTPADITSK